MACRRGENMMDGISALAQWCAVAAIAVGLIFSWRKNGKSSAEREGAFKNEVENIGKKLDSMDITNEEKELFVSYMLGTKISLMIAFIESNFIDTTQMKVLRKFKKIEGIPSDIHQSLLSCFIYIRDCIAHNPKLILLSPGDNTDNFVRILNEGGFNFATIKGEEITIDSGAIHHLHLTIRRFYNL